MPGKSVLFNFDGPDNVNSLRVPWKETPRLVDFIKNPADFGQILVVNYSSIYEELTVNAAPDPSKDKIRWLIEDIRALYQWKDNLAVEEKKGNVIIETLGSLGDEVLDFIVASNGRKDTQIQDYKIAKYKIQSILGSLMGLGLNFILTGHLQAEREEITGRGRITPMIWGKDLPASIPRMFGEVFQSLVVSDAKSPGGIAYKWLTKPDPTGFIGFLGTRRFDDLPKFINQDFGYLVDLEKALTSKEVKK